MANVQLIGLIKSIAETVQVTESFKKRDFVLQTDNDTPYPQIVALQTSQDKCNLLDGFNVGDYVKVSVNIRGKEYEKDGKKNVFNTLDAWRFEKIGANTQPVPQPQYAQPTPVAQPQANAMPNTEIADDLPF